ncbi:MAG: cysteine hydrolase [Lachnospiraceae bacterium]|nr:cysteine hydrolase [Lachnospiraceae bacterium]
MRKLLVVVDMQKDFIDGSLGTKEAEKIVDGVVEEIKKYRTEDIFATRDTHTEDYLQTQEGKKLPVVHCVKGTEGWEINGKVKEALKGAEVMDKPTFGSKELAEKIAGLAAEEEIEVTLVGLCTDICVVSNALLIKAYLPEVPVRVLASCCAGVTPESHQAALATMKMCQVEIV